MEREFIPIAPTPLKEVDWDNLPFGFIPTKEMYVAEYKDGAWADAGLMPVAGFTIHPAASALHYGQAIFEGLKARRTEKGEIVLFRAIENGKRMAKGCRRLMMPEYPPGKFLDAVKETVLANKEYIPPHGKGELYVRPFIFGSGPVLGVSPAKEYLFMVFAAPVGPYFKTGFKPIRLYIEYHYHRAVCGGVGGVKAAGNYAAGMYPASLAKEKEFAEVLYLDANNDHFEEVGAANFFLRRGNELATPSLGDESILPGITRESVLILAGDMGLNAVGRDVLKDEIYEADECFCTGTAAVITPIGAVHAEGKDHTIGDGGVGKYTKELYDKLESVMNKEEEDKYGWVETIGNV
jgi:branched-chain amino acid aminotransferase